MTHDFPVRPRIASVAGTDSGGGAGLSADQRAAQAFDVHLCPVVAAVTAQHSRAVRHVEALSPALLQAQLDALAEDLPPAALKTGLLGSAANARVLARWVDAQRRHQPGLALVVDPVLRASTGAPFADAELLAAYRDELLPRATLVTPNRREAAALLGQPDEAGPDALPAQAAALRALGAQAVLLTGGDALDETQALDWLDSPQARGGLAHPRIATPHSHGTGCTLASAAAAALARGFPVADAAVLAKLLTTHALRQAGPQGAGAGPVWATPGWGQPGATLPTLGWDDLPPAPARPGAPAFAPGLYGIVDSAEAALALLRQPGLPLRHLQLRCKAPPTGADAAWHAALADTIRRCLPVAEAAGVTLWVNDHWETALAAGARALHLGQEDWAGLSPAQRRRLQQARAREGVALGLSSHSVWELARAAGLRPSYIACGPVWPTTTKAMPWRPQGLDNLAWWAALSPAPVVAIGGVLQPDQARRRGRRRQRGVPGARPGRRHAAGIASLAAGLAGRPTAPPERCPHAAPDWPHPSLTPTP
jgi:hydroxymethylpyrimidine kinase/phosphomethylpyrimidine kinase/thiamine-phosphate diphosphorylase